ncbi:MAG TPA: hypothetical protein VL049_28980, partial [Candidatus Dormibacteraeota bacterium]|nr:hypothetical protein [Candidatus Dormibacteraeota bacterium]
VGVAVAVPVGVGVSVAVPVAVAVPVGVAQVLSPVPHDAPDEMLQQLVELPWPVQNVVQAVSPSTVPQPRWSGFPAFCPLVLPSAQTQQSARALWGPRTRAATAATTASAMR